MCEKSSIYKAFRRFRSRLNSEPVTRSQTSRLPVATKALSSQASLLTNRQVAATPFSSLTRPPGALGNVPNCATPRKIFNLILYYRTIRFVLRFQTSRLPVATKALSSQASLLTNRQVAATPFSSLTRPPGALGNVPNCATPRNI